MKSRAENSGGSNLPRGRRAAKICAALLPLLAACGPQAPAEQRSVRQDPEIMLEDPGPLKKPLPEQRVGESILAFVCKGYTVVDGNRWVQNPILDKAQADRGNYTPMTVKRQAYSLDIDPSPPQEYLKYYDEQNRELPKGEKPVCNVYSLMIAAVKTTMPNAIDPPKPNEMTFHTFGEAYFDLASTQPRNPNHVYDLDFGKDPLAAKYLAHNERIR